ncbi:MAG: glutathione S-transferase N-terminal domain-containing protein [Alphaproteobacteria bacterium]|nr:glutathione S-transferase N-terminal domain-containing protein [Alphaproteobacteria bacterium]
MAEFELYNAPQSICSHKVRFALHAKSLAFAEHKLDLFSGDQLTPEYLAINPNGLVPTLIHNGANIIDSLVIVQYLDELFPEPAPLVPQDPVARARMRSLMAYIDEVPTPAVRVPSYNMAFLIHYQNMSDDEFQALANAKPLRKEFLLKFGRVGFPEKELNEALDRLGRALARMQAEIVASGGPWIVGKNMTIADIAMMPVIVRLDDLDLDHMWDSKPEISRWFEAIQAHPAYEPTFYHGSLLTEQYPHLRKQ